MEWLKQTGAVNQRSRWVRSGSRELSGHSAEACLLPCWPSCCTTAVAAHVEKE